jgi:hypothetical protein
MKVANLSACGCQFSTCGIDKETIVLIKSRVHLPIAQFLLQLLHSQSRVGTTLLCRTFIILIISVKASSSLPFLTSGKYLMSLNESRYQSLTFF